MEAEMTPDDVRDLPVMVDVPDERSESVAMRFIDSFGGTPSLCRLSPSGDV